MALRAVGACVFLTILARLTQPWHLFRVFLTDCYAVAGLSMNFARINPAVTQNRKS